MWWEVSEKFSWESVRNGIIHPHGYPAHMEKSREGAKNGTGLGKSVKTGGNDGFRRKGVGSEVLCARQGQTRVSSGVGLMDKRSLAGFSSP